MALRTLYLQSHLSITGRDALRGRLLYDRLRQLSEETLLGQFVCSDEDAATVNDPRLKTDMVSQSLLRDLQPNIVFMEGGLFVDNAGSWKIPENIATEVCTEGGVLVVADVNSNELRYKKDYYIKAGNFFSAYAKYSHNWPDEPICGSDRRSCWNGGQHEILCNPEKMSIDEWARPIYDGIPEVLVGLPVRLDLTSCDSIIASCNSDTARIADPSSGGYFPDPCPFASAHQIGAGFAVLVAGSVTSDVWLEGCVHNSVWLTNLAEFLVEEARVDRARRLSHRRSRHLLFLSHRSTDKKIVDEIATAIKRGGINVWLDKEELVPSQSLTAEISRALGKMTHFILFWSSSCLGAAWVERELNSAIALLIEKAIPLLIARLDETPVPNIVADLYRIEGLGETEQAIGERIVEAVERLARKGGA